MNRTYLKLMAVAAGVGLGAASLAGSSWGDNVRLAQASGGTPAAAAKPATTLAQAVRSAEQRTKGRAAKVKLEREDGVYLYEVKTVSKEGPVEVEIDFATGKVGRVKGRGIMDRIEGVFDKEDAREDAALLKALEASPVTLVRAIEAAESNTGGRAIKAKLKDRYGVSYFEVALLVEGSKRRVEVDSASARVIAVKARKRDDDDND